MTTKDEVRSVMLAHPRFGRWLVLSAGRYANYKQYWHCVCDCGVTRQVREANLISGISVSCGCYKRARAKEIHTRHGKYLTPEYKVWTALKCRCSVKNNPKYKNYGARGIRVCSRWKNSFENFIDDIGPRPAGKFSIERIDNNGPYSPKNCKWGTSAEQSVNKTNTKRYKWKGMYISIPEIHRRSKTLLKLDTLYSRIRKYGWPLSRALSQPV